MPFTPAIPPFGITMPIDCGCRQGLCCPERGGPNGSGSNYPPTLYMKLTEVSTPFSTDWDWVEGICNPMPWVEHSCLWIGTNTYNIGGNDYCLSTVYHCFGDEEGGAGHFGGASYYHGPCNAPTGGFGATSVSWEMVSCVPWRAVHDPDVYGDPESSFFFYPEIRMADFHRGTVKVDIYETCPDIDDEEEEPGDGTMAMLNTIREYTAMPYEDAEPFNPLSMPSQDELRKLSEVVNPPKKKGGCCGSARRAEVLENIRRQQRLK